jgi:hypothetical protein
MEDVVEYGKAKGEVTVAVEVAAYLTACYSAENIFAMIRRDPTGKDGSVLAEIRDLRRYLLLVEAEMISRGVVSGQDTVERVVPRYDLPAGQIADFTIAVRDFDGDVVVPGTPEDGGQHARQPVEMTAEEIQNLTVGEMAERIDSVTAPWLVSRFKLRRVMSPRLEVIPALDFLYEDHGAGLSKLRPEMTEAKNFELRMMATRIGPSVARSMLVAALDCYVAVSGRKMHVLEVGRAPTDYRSAWPTFTHEYNAHEMIKLMPAWVKSIYDWSEGESKYKIRPEFSAWKREH